MEKLITRKEAAEILGISIATLDAARNNGLISYVQYVHLTHIFSAAESGNHSTGLFRTSVSSCSRSCHHNNALS